MPTKVPVDGLKHTVKEGQWVGNIALMYGFAEWEADVWNHDQNSDLKNLRKDPHVLAVGDELFIPPWQEKKESCAVEQKHTFKLKTPSETIRVRILDEDGEPVKNAKYTLTLDYEGNGITFKQQNTSTDGDGVMTEVIPSTVQSGVVRIADAKLEIELEFGLAPLNASEEVAIIGAKQRLKAT